MGLDIKPDEMENLIGDVTGKKKEEEKKDEDKDKKWKLFIRHNNNSKIQ